jgi:hypothetical protein
MELDLQSLFELHVHSCTHWLRPRSSPPFTLHLGSYTRELLVSQHRRHLCVTPWFEPTRRTKRTKYFSRSKVWYDKRLHKYIYLTWPPELGRRHPRPREQPRRFLYINTVFYIVFRIRSGSIILLYEDPDPDPLGFLHFSLLLSFFFFKKVNFR